MRKYKYILASNIDKYDDWDIVQIIPSETRDYIVIKKEDNPIQYKSDEPFNISFKELVDYIRDKDFEITKLKYNNNELNKEVKELRERESVIGEYLREKGITIAIERNRVFELEKEGENNE